MYAYIEGKTKEGQTVFREEVKNQYSVFPYEGTPLYNRLTELEKLYPDLELYYETMKD